MMVDLVMLDDLVIHDVSDPACQIGLASANFGSGPEPRVSTAIKPRADGSINRTRFWEARIIELTGYVGAGAAENAAVLDQLRAAFALGRPLSLRFRPYGQSAELELQVIPASRFDAPVSGWAQTIRWGITLEAPDPRMYGIDVHSASAEPYEGAGGTTAGLFFALDFALVFTDTVTAPGGGTLSAYNYGTATTPVELTLDGPVTSLQGIRNLTTGDEVAFVLTGLDAGETIVIDTGARTVTMDGMPMPELIDASDNTWFQLVPGENILEVNGSGFTAGETLLTARYRDARL